MADKKRKTILCVFQKVKHNEGEAFTIEQDGFESSKDAKNWIGENGKANVTYRYGSISEKDIKVQKETVSKLIES